MKFAVSPVAGPQPGEHVEADSPEAAMAAYRAKHKLPAHAGLFVVGVPAPHDDNAPPVEAE